MQILSRSNNLSSLNQQFITDTLQECTLYLKKKMYNHKVKYLNIINSVGDSSLNQLEIMAELIQDSYSFREIYHVFLSQTKMTIT